MTSGSTVYRLPQANWALEFGASAVETFQKHVQASRRSKESVGQLYSKDLTGDHLVVDVATVLKPTWAAWARVRLPTPFGPRKSNACGNLPARIRAPRKPRSAE